MLALSFLVAMFTVLTLLTPAAHAADTAKWQNGNLQYQNNPYSGPLTSQSGDGFGLPDNTITYQYLESGLPQKIHMLYFPSGTDPSKASDATYVVYTRGPTGGIAGKTDPQQVSIDTASQAQATQTPNGGGGASGGSCKVSGGLAWLICPATNTLASVMDWVFNVVASYLEVQPLLTTSTDNVIMTTWNIMRNFANVVFVIVFIFIIYSQLTSMGISNYGIKKMLPRLIIAAVLVNVSYWICAIGIDLSNITGHAIYDLFLWLRNTIADMKDVKGWQFIDWQSFVTFAMAGGGAAIGGTALWIHLASTLGAFSVTGVVMMILPILVILFLIILVVMLILAARQAIIILLVMVSPLAFVAYLLPNTEKWFEKWRETFFAMLVFFPAFAMVFGGAQLAGFTIIKTATNINMVILGLAVQVAPLAITPLIMKLSNGVLARVAGVINSPRKGLSDRTRNWANDRLAARRAYEMSKSRQMQESRTLGRRHIMRRTALHHDNEHRMREGLKAVNEEMATSMFNRSEDGEELARAQLISTNLKERSTNEVKRALQSEINMRGSELHLDNVRLEASKMMLDNENKQTAAMIEEYKSGLANTAGSYELSNLADTMRDVTVQNAAQTQRAQAAGNMQQKMIADRFTSEGLASEALRRVAASVDPNGMTRAKANAEANLSKIDKEARDNTMQLLNIEALKNGLTVKAYTSKIMDAVTNATDIEIDKARKIYAPRTTLTSQEIEAALEQQAVEGNVWGLEQARGSLHVDQSMLSRVIARNASTMKQKGGFHLQDQPDLSIDIIREEKPSLSEAEVKQLFEERMAAARIKSFAETSPDSLTDFKVGYFAKVSEELDGIIKLAKSSGDAKVQKDLEDNLKAMRRNIHIATVNPDISRRMAVGPKAMADMDEALEKNRVPLVETPEEMAKERFVPGSDTGPKD